MSYRSWCFTLNNYQPSDIDQIRDWEVKRLVVGEEVGESGTPHLQGYVVFMAPKRLAGVKKLPSGDRMHWEKTNFEKAAEKYCKKDGKICIEIDNSKKSSSEFTEFVEGVKRGRSDLELLEDHPQYLARYPSFANRVRLLTSQAKRAKGAAPEVTWVWGPTGSGKTRWVFEREDELDFVTMQKPFVLGYTGKPAVVFDDFRADMVDFAFLLRLLDRYPVVVPLKGGEGMWAPLRIYITTPRDIGDSFFHGEDLDQLRRRVTAVTRFPLSELLPLPIQGLPSNTEGLGSPFPPIPVNDLDMW